MTTPASIASATEYEITRLTGTPIGEALWRRLLLRKDLMTKITEALSDAEHRNGVLSDLKTILNGAPGRERTLLMGALNTLCTTHLPCGPVYQPLFEMNLLLRGTDLWPGLPDSWRQDRVRGLLIRTLEQLEELLTGQPLMTFQEILAFAEYVVDRTEPRRPQLSANLVARLYALIGRAARKLPLKDRRALHDEMTASALLPQRYDSEKHDVAWDLTAALRLQEDSKTLILMHERRFSLNPEGRVVSMRLDVHSTLSPENQKDALLWGLLSSVVHDSQLAQELHAAREGRWRDWKLLADEMKRRASSPNFDHHTLRQHAGEMVRCWPTPELGELIAGMKTADLQVLAHGPDGPHLKHLAGKSKSLKTRLKTLKLSEKAPVAAGT